MANSYQLSSEKCAIPHFLIVLGFMISETLQELSDLTRQNADFSRLMHSGEWNTVAHISSLLVFIVPWITEGGGLAQR